MKQKLSLLVLIIQSVRRILKSNNGNGVALMGSILLLLVVMPLSLYQLDITLAINSKSRIERAVTVSALASLYNVSIGVDLGDVQKSIIAENFEYFLKKNLNLDNNFIPKSGLIKDPIVIKEIIVYDSTDTPTICPYGKEITLPSIHIVIETQIKRLYKGDVLGEYIPITVHKDIDVLETGSD